MEKFWSGSEPRPSPGPLWHPGCARSVCAGLGREAQPAVVQTTASAAFGTSSSHCFCSSAFIRYILCSAHTLQSAGIKLSKNAHVRYKWDFSPKICELRPLSRLCRQSGYCQRRDTAAGVAGGRAQSQGTASVGKTGLLVFKFP